MNSSLSTLQATIKLMEHFYISYSSDVSHEFIIVTSHCLKYLYSYYILHSYMLNSFGLFIVAYLYILILLTLYAYRIMHKYIIHNSQ